MLHVALSPDIDAVPVISPLAEPVSHEHLVHFYEDDESLIGTAGEFLRAGLTQGEAAIVIATPEHRTALLGYLKGSDVETALASGRLLFADAGETLATFMSGGLPDPARFNRTLDDLMARVARGRQGVRIRAYGEMVDLLWREGSRSAAVYLEDLWNKAGASRSFSLLCAYVMASFYREGGPQQMSDLCQSHSRVLTSATRADNADAAGAKVDVEVLQERLRALEAENDHLKAVQGALRKSIGERLDNSEARFRLLVESVRDYAIFILDPSGIVSTWNAGAERIKGYASTEIIGQHFSKFYPQDEIDAGKCERELAVAEREGRFEDEGWRLRKDGTRFWANVVITALRDPSGALFGFAKVTRDLTDRMLAENARIELVRREEADRRKDEFLAIMGHELRNPLAPLATAIQMIRLRGGRATEKEMGILDRQLRQMTKVISDLLDASRAMRETVALTPSVVEIGEVLANAVDIASPLIQDQHHNLIIDAADNGLLVSVDPDRMAQVFGNVLNNAAKYTHCGGTIELKAAAEGEDVVVTVSDNGQGISHETLGQIFNLFTQGDRGLERTGGGLGIGLAVARRIVLAHRGSIVAKSDGPGRGSRFVVRLPRASVLAPAPGRPTPTVLHTGSRRKIIIVDDNRDAVEMMQTLLEHSGHDVSVAYDGPSALKLCEEMKPDALFLDIGLPGMDGYEVARRARELGSCKRIPIVAVSGYARGEDCARALANGFSAHLTKPVDLDEVARLLEAC